VTAKRSFAITPLDTKAGPSSAQRFCCRHPRQPHRTLRPLRTCVLSVAWCCGGVVWCGVVWCGVVWSGLVCLWWWWWWCGGMVWYGVVVVVWWWYGVVVGVVVGEGRGTMAGCRERAY
jgi:hypothetical protein